MRLAYLQRSCKGRQEFLEAIPVASLLPMHTTWVCLSHGSASMAVAHTRGSRPQNQHQSPAESLIWHKIVMHLTPPLPSPHSQPRARALLLARRHPAPPPLSQRRRGRPPRAGPLRFQPIEHHLGSTQHPGGHLRPPTPHPAGRRPLAAPPGRRLPGAVARWPARRPCLSQGARQAAGNRRPEEASRLASLASGSEQRRGNLPALDPRRRRASLRGRHGRRAPDWRWRAC